MQKLVQPNAVLDLNAARELNVEIENIEAQHGPNPYTDYLRKHGKRPPKAEAIAIGQLMGARVQADDGSMRPRPSAAMRKARKERHEAFARHCGRVEGLKAAIAMLAALGDTVDLIREFGSPDIVADVDAAVSCLQRITGQVHGWKQIKNAANSNAHCRSPA